MFFFYRLFGCFYLTAPHPAKHHPTLHHQNPTPTPSPHPTPPTLPHHAPPDITAPHLTSCSWSKVSLIPLHLPWCSWSKVSLIPPPPTYPGAAGPRCPSSPHLPCCSWSKVSLILCSADSSSASRDRWTSCRFSSYSIVQRHLYNPGLGTRATTFATI